MQNRIDSKSVGSMMGSNNEDEAHLGLEGPMPALDHPLATADPLSEEEEEEEEVKEEEKEDVCDYLNISVSDPTKESESNKSTFVTYLITSDYNGSKFSVRRRFKDIVALSDLLTESYRGFFIPPRPDKSVLERQVMQKQEFVEQRRSGLERYFTRLSAHPVIRRSHELRLFLQTTTDMPLPSTTSAIAPLEAKNGRDFIRLFKELKQSVVMDWGGSDPRLQEDDNHFLQNKDRLNQLHHHLTNASKHAESFVKAQQQTGVTFGELGLAFIKLSKFENEQATSVSQKTRVTHIKTIATAAVKAGRLYRGLNTRTVNHLDTLHEYMGLMLAVQGAFSDRSSALLTAQTLISELSSLHARAEKIETSSSNFFGADKSRPRKMEELKEAIRVTEDAKSCALKEYERIKENNRSEIERLDRERKADFMNMLTGFVTNQVAYAEKIENEWATVAEETSRYAKQCE